MPRNVEYCAGVGLSSSFLCILLIMSIIFAIDVQFSDGVSVRTLD